MSKKLTIEYIRKRTEELAIGYKLLSSEYKGNKQKLLFECKREHEFQMSWADFDSGEHRCPICYRKFRAGNSQRLTLKFVKEYIEKEGYECLSEKYVSSHVKLELKCPKGHIFKKSWACFQRGQRCPKCWEERRGSTNRKTIEEVEEFAKSIDYTCLSTNYKNCKSKLIFLCDKDHKFEVDWTHFNRGQRCPKCLELKRKVLKENREKAKKLRKENNKQRLSKSLKGNKYRLNKPPNNKIHFVNQDFFKEIDNEAKAYWLGFILADGCVTNNCYRFQLAIKDEDHLYRFRKSVNYTGNIKSYKKDFYTLNINDRKFVMNLVDKGVIPRKTRYVTFPTFIPNMLLNHFIRGYYDGDGCISIYTSKHHKLYLGVSVLGTEAFIKELGLTLKRKCSLKSSTFYYNKRGHIWCFSRSMQQAIKICEYLYKDATIYLERKHDKYIEYLRIRGISQ